MRMKVTKSEILKIQNRQQEWVENKILSNKKFNII